MIIRPREVRPSTQRLCEVYGKWRRSRAWLLPLCAVACGRLSLCMCSHPVHDSTVELFRAPSAWIHESWQELRPDHVPSLLSPRFSCRTSYIMSMTSAGTYAFLEKYKVFSFLTDPIPLVLPAAPRCVPFDSGEEVRSFSSSRLTWRDELVVF